MREAIAAELERIEESADHSAQSQFSSTKFWRFIHLALGCGTAVSAGLASAGALGDLAGQIAVGIAALVATALGSVLTALNPSQRSERAHVAANAYLSLRDRARVMRTVDLGELSGSESRARFEALAEKREAINAEAPVPAFLAYWFGRRNIQRGRTKHRVDEVG